MAARSNFPVEYQFIMNNKFSASAGAIFNQLRRGEQLTKNVTLALQAKRRELNQVRQVITGVRTEYRVLNAKLFESVRALRSVD